MEIARVDGLLERADRAAAAIRGLPPRAAVAREMRSIRRAEIFASTALAGSRLSAPEVDALLDAGRAVGDHAFDDYVLVRAYGEAATWVAEARPAPAGAASSLLTVDEVRQLNARATARSGARGGAWRQSNDTSEGDVVSPAAWLVAREVTALVDRFGRGPQGQPAGLWLARFIGRFARIRPFEAANGRTGRLAANLLLRRIDYPPLVFEQRDRAKYARALTAAETNAPGGLARLIATAIVRSSNRLSAAAGSADDRVAPLRELAGADYAALAKAAQRGRLRTIVRGGRYFTTANWIAEYRAGARATRSRAELPDRPIP